MGKFKEFINESKNEITIEWMEKAKQLEYKKLEKKINIPKFLKTSSVQIDPFLKKHKEDFKILFDVTLKDRPKGVGKKDDYYPQIVFSHIYYHPLDKKLKFYSKFFPEDTIADKIINKDEDIFKTINDYIKKSADKLKVLEKAPNKAYKLPR